MDPISDLIIKTLIGYGPSGILIAIIIFFAKSYVKKSFSSFIEYIEKQEKTSDNIVKGMENLDRTLVKILESQEKSNDMFMKHAQDDAKTFDDMNRTTEELTGKIIELRNSSSGNLSDVQVANIVGVYSGKVHAQLMLWWNIRCEHNHILESSPLVKQRYTDRYIEVISKWRSELVQFRYMGMPLDRFDGGGISLFYSDIFKVLFEIQFSLARGVEPSYKKEQLQEYFDRKQSILMGAARAWCSSGKTLMDTLKESPVDLMPGDIHWLTDEVRQFESSDPSGKYSPFI
jgi:hypothetical protein